MKTPLTKKVEALGYNGDQTDFEKLLWSVFSARFGGWTVDDLVCEPESALNFCRVIRQSTGLKFPNKLILKTLMNTRKSRRYLLYS